MVSASMVSASGIGSPDGKAWLSDELFYLGPGQVISRVVVAAAHAVGTQR
jgi:hypothetical protein